jgi:protein CpxP
MKFHPLVATALASACLGLSATAMAQSTAQMPMQQPHMHQSHAAGQHPDKLDEHHTQHRQGMEKRRNERLAQLKSTLNISPDQEAAWSAFVSRTTHRDGPRQPRPDFSKLTTPERLQQMQANKARRDAQITQISEATLAFYNSLKPEQQKLFDQQAQAYGLGMKAGRHSMHHRS